jgi:hypothetical protein
MTGALLTAHGAGGTKRKPSVAVPGAGKGGAWSQAAFTPTAHGVAVRPGSARVGAVDRTAAGTRAASRTSISGGRGRRSREDPRTARGTECSACGFGRAVGISAGRRRGVDRRAEGGHEGSSDEGTGGASGTADGVPTIFHSIDGVAEAGDGHDEVAELGLGGGTWATLLFPRTVNGEAVGGPGGRGIAHANAVGLAPSDHSVADQGVDELAMDVRVRHIIVVEGSGRPSQKVKVKLLISKQAQTNAPMQRAQHSKKKERRKRRAC